MRLVRRLQAFAEHPRDRSLTVSSAHLAGFAHAGVERCPRRLGQRRAFLETAPLRPLRAQDLSESAAVAEQRSTQPASARGNTFLQVQGALTLDGSLLVEPGPDFGAGRYPLISYTGQLTDAGLEVGALPRGLTGTVDVETSPGQVDLVVEAAGG